MSAAQHSVAFGFPFSSATCNSHSVLESSPSRSGSTVRLNRYLQRPTKGMWEREEKKSLTSFWYCVFKETSVQTAFQDKKKERKEKKKPFQSYEPDRSDTQTQSRTTQTDAPSLGFCKQWKVEVVAQRKGQINTYLLGFRHKCTHTYRQTDKHTHTHTHTDSDSR